MSAVCDTLILSDLHLGSEISRARDALRMLNQSSFQRLILLGDIFSELNFGPLKKEHWQFLGYIRKLSNPKRQVEVALLKSFFGGGGFACPLPASRPRILRAHPRFHAD
jgi:metallophosphoesterase superfamily enzyme